MDGVFPRQSISTPFVKHNHSQVYHDDNTSPLDNIMKYSSSNSSSSNSSQHSYSPPMSSTPQRVARKPVSNYPAAAVAVRSSPNNEWKTSSPALSSASRQRNYQTAETVYPNRNQILPVNPIQATGAVISSSSPLPSAAEKQMRARCHSVASKPTFWYPRVDKKEDESQQHLKRGLSKKIRGLLQPHRAQIDEGSLKEYAMACKSSLKKCRRPEINHQDNPFQILSFTYNESERNGPAVQMNQIDFAQVDNYACAVQQRGPLLTPTLLSQKFLIRPYRRDLFRLRALFIWMVQNIRPEYHQKRNDLILLQKQSQLQPIIIPKSSNMRQRFSKSTQEDHHYNKQNHNISNPNHNNNTTLHDVVEIAAQRLDAMDLLQEESSLLLENLNNAMHESADHVLETRSCQSAFGMSHLFAVMAVAAGFAEAQVIYGYLKAPKDDLTLENSKLPINHAWCSVKIDGEYRFIDCWLGSPFYPQNENKMESHWFLTEPLDMVMTHFPKSNFNQFLNPPLTQHAFFNLPLVRNPFFWHRMLIIDYKNHIDGNGVFYMGLKIEESNVSCYAETEADDGTISKGLAQCFTDDYRYCMIKAVLPPHQTKGWLKIYAGPKIMTTSNHSQQEMIHKNHYPLAMCIRISQTKPEPKPFNFVQLYVDHNEFYIQEPQCYELYPLQSYHFCIRGNRVDSYNRATHHKLAIKSPGGKLIKLMYYPQDQTYDGTVKVTETGTWSLICLLHHTGGWYTVASWFSTINKK